MSKYPNSGILSRNKNRKTDRHPEFTGSAEVGGQEFWLSAWIKEGQHGKFFSLSFQPKDAQKSAGEESQVPTGEGDVPF